MESIISPQTSMVCPRCRDERVFRDTNIFISGSGVHTTPNSRFGTGPISPVQALVCPTCGYLELWASEPEKLSE